MLWREVHNLFSAEKRTWNLEDGWLRIRTIFPRKPKAGFRGRLCLHLCAQHLNWIFPNNFSEVHLSGLLWLFLPSSDDLVVGSGPILPWRLEQLS